MTDPILDNLDLGTGGDGGATVHIGITHPDSDSTTTADIATADPDTLAGALVACLHGVAAMHGPDLQLALQLKMGETL